MRADESLLNGESVATNGHEAPADADAAIGDRSSMLHAGTLVAAGHSGVIAATGADSRIGRIGRTGTLIGSVESLQTPLLRQIDRFSWQCNAFALGTAALLFAFAVMARDYAWVDAFMLVVALAVSMVPAGLPAVITITLAIGVRRMAARHAIGRLPAVETPGATTVTGIFGTFNWAGYRWLRRGAGAHDGGQRPGGDGDCPPVQCPLHVHDLLQPARRAGYADGALGRGIGDNGRSSRSPMHPGCRRCSRPGRCRLPMGS